MKLTEQEIEELLESYLSTDINMADALQKAADITAAKYGWISMKDRRPTKEDGYSGRSPYKSDAGACQFLHTKSGFLQLKWDDDSEDLTHWRIIPPLPADPAPPTLLQVAKKMVNHAKILTDDGRRLMDDFSKAIAAEEAKMKEAAK